MRRALLADASLMLIKSRKALHSQTRALVRLKSPSAPIELKTIPSCSVVIEVSVPDSTKRAAT